MSTANGKQNARSKTGARIDRLRPLNLPQPVRVELDETGLPLFVAESYDSTTLQLCPPENDAELCTTVENDVARKAIESILEIWHVDDEWWREPISRRCVEVILEGGKHVILYEERTTNDWFMQRP